MIKIKSMKLSMKEVEAIKKKAYTEKQATFDKDKSELTFTVNIISGESFMLVYHKKMLFVIAKGTKNTTTTSIYTIEEFATKKETLDRVKILKLEYNSPKKEGK